MPLTAPERVNCVPLAGAKVALLASVSGAAIVCEPALTATNASLLVALSMSTFVPLPCST